MSVTDARALIKPVKFYWFQKNTQSWFFSELQYWLFPRRSEREIWRPPDCQFRSFPTVSNENLDIFLFFYSVIIILGEKKRSFWCLFVRQLRKEIYIYVIFFDKEKKNRHLSWLQTIWCTVSNKLWLILLLLLYVNSLSPCDQSPVIVRLLGQKKRDYLIWMGGG
jgi:hypothetical protein